MCFAPVLREVVFCSNGAVGEASVVTIGHFASTGHLDTVSTIVGIIDVQLTDILKAGLSIEYLCWQTKGVKMEVRCKVVLSNRARE